MAIKYSSVTISSARGGAVSAATATRALNADPTSRRFQQAVETLETGCWSEAFSSLSDLANRGHAPSARIALMLARRGTSLFGGTFPATQREKAHWQRIGE